MKSNRTCHILVVDGFEENSVSQTIEILRTLDVDPIILNLFVSPKIGTKFAKDKVIFQLISDFEEMPLPNGLLFAGGEACARHFMIDPRVARLAIQMLETSKPVGFLYPAITPLIDRLLPAFSGQPLFVQEKSRIFQFLHNFSNYIHVPQSPLFNPQSATLMHF